MEAVPKLPLISFELKMALDPSCFGPKLKHYISEAYREDPESYNNEIYQLESLRATAVRPTLDQEGLKVLTKYFCQLRAMQSRFPMAKGQPAACSFSWKDLYANMTCVLPDIRYEMACILYNIGALHSMLGASEPRTSPESLKAACTHFQNAAWAFLYVREHFTQPTGVDVSAEIMRLLQEICFAQAQECILDKSIQDTKKPSVVGAVATQVVYFYKNALALLGSSSGTDNIYEIVGTKLFKYWHHYLSFKTFYIGSIVCLYQGLNAEEQQKMGERVAYYQLAVDKLIEARKLTKYIEPVKIAVEALTFTNDVVEGKRKAAKNENEYIYHEEVPEKDLLTDMKPVCLVKALPIELNNQEVSGPDIFSRLVPMGAHEASSLYSEEKAKLLRHVVAETETKNTEFIEFMSSLQLEQLEVLDTDQKIPQEIVDRCAAMNAKTEIIQSLVDSMNNLAEIISDVEHSLGEIKNFIQEETMKEKDYQKVMGPRPPSIVQTELSREFHKYQEAHTRTNESNQVLHKAMTLHIANLRLLAQPLDVLQSKIPSLDNIEGLDRETMSEMRRVVGKAREMQHQRDSLLHQLREAVNADDITSQLLARSSEPTEEIFKQEIEKHTPTVKIIEQNLAAQENIINRLTSLYASYADSRRLLSDVLRKREGLINALITSYDTYEELLGKSQKGLEFYKKLSLNVNQLLTRLKGTCQVQEEERSQLLSKQSAPARSTPPAIPTGAKTTESMPEPTSGGALKLKDYLPYMKNRGMPGNIPPQAQTDALLTETYYPESIYPTSVRPAPLGSEDMTQMQLPDGMAMSKSIRNLQDNYNRDPYSTCNNDPYAVPSYNYPTTSKGYEYDNHNSGNYGYSTSYIPNQYSSQVCAGSQFTNPHYSGTQNNTTSVTDSQNMMYNSHFNESEINVNHEYNPNSYPDSFAHGQQTGLARDSVTPTSGYNTTVNVNQDLNPAFAQMQVSPKSEPSANYGVDYSQTFYNMQYPQTSMPNMAATYSHALQNSNTSMVSSQVPSGYSSLNYPYSTDPAQIQHDHLYNVANHPNQTGITRAPYSIAEQKVDPVSNNYNMKQLSFECPMEALSQGYIYTNSDSGTTSISSMINAPQAMPVTAHHPYSYPGDTDSIDPAVLAQLEAMDQPIKSHVTGEALSTYSSNYHIINPNTNNFINNAGQTSIAFTNNEQNYQQNSQNLSISGYTNPTEQNVQPIPQNSLRYGQNLHTHYAEEEINYSHSAHQNHPGYNLNPSTGVYEYSYGSQNTYMNKNSGLSHVESKAIVQDPNWSGVYTSAGIYETVQSPSETSQVETPQSENQLYVNATFTTTFQSNVIPANSTPISTYYGAEVNQSTYMQSGLQSTTVTFTNNEVSTPAGNEMGQPNFDQNSGHISKQTDQIISSESNDTVSSNVAGIPQDNIVKSETNPEATTEKSAFDLLSGIDFTVETKPLMPEIKVPQISENVIIKRPTVTAKLELETKLIVKEDVIERPAKADTFSHASMLNRFTQEVKQLQKFVDTLTNRTSSGLTVLDCKWMTLQDFQARENSRSKYVAAQHSEGSIVTDVVPYDDSRLTLKSNPDAYINASFYKQLASWCIPLVISKNPNTKEYKVFWKAVLENKIGCIVCLLSDIEMQGKSYWPTAIGHSLDFDGDIKVTLNSVSCTVHWTERKMTVTCGPINFNVTHYQISVFPAKIACSPLVLLADKILSLTYTNKLSNQLSVAWIQCEAGAGRSSVLALLIMVMCQVRAGQLDLCDMLDAGSANLYKNRTNVLEDTKFLADAFRTTLYFVQGVLCSGTTSFNGETVSAPTGAEVLPPVPTISAAPTDQKPQKFSRESFEVMKQSPGLKSGDMKDPLNFLDPLWNLKKK